MSQAWDAVCAVDGVPAAMSRSGRWVHLGGLPESADPEHEVVPVGRADFMRGTSRAVMLRETASDMLQHHDSLHPSADCPWSARLRLALRTR